jgi:hypothetical protein
MDAEIKTKWLKALRSGRYKQGNSELLNDRGSYCCLGVLAKVQGAKKNEILHCGYLTDDLAKYAAGIKIKSQHLLAKFNDGNPDSSTVVKSFKEIADYIEKNYK